MRLTPLRLPAARVVRSAVVIVLACLAGSVVGEIVHNHVGNDARPLPFRDLTRSIGRLTVFGAPTPHVFRYEKRYVRYISERLGTAIPAGFPDHMVVFFAVGPRSTPAYRLRVERVLEKRDAIEVQIRETAPGVGDTTPPALTFPYRAISIPWSAKPVTIDWLGRP